MAGRRASESEQMVKKSAARQVKSESDVAVAFRPLQIVDSLTLLSAKGFKKLVADKMEVQPEPPNNLSGVCHEAHCYPDACNCEVDVDMDDVLLGTESIQMKDAPTAGEKENKPELPTNVPTQHRGSDQCADYANLKDVLSDWVSSEKEEGSSGTKKDKSERTVSFDPTVLFVPDSSEAASLDLSLMNVSSIPNSTTDGNSTIDCSQLMIEWGKTAEQLQKAATLLSNHATDKRSECSCWSKKKADNSTDEPGLRRAALDASSVGELIGALNGGQSLAEHVKLLELIADHYVRLNKLMAQKSQSRA